MKKGEKTAVLRKLGPDSFKVQRTEQAFPSRWSGLVVVLIALGLVITSCNRGSPGSTPAGVQNAPLNSASRGPGSTLVLVVPPSPTATLSSPGTGHRPAGEKAYKGEPAPRIVTVTNSVATSLAPGWTRYDSINQVFDLAFSPDGTLWAATGGGLVHWLPDSGSYTRYEVWPSQLALAPDGTLWLAMDGGLWHFDGSNLKFQMAPKLLDGAIRSIVVGADGLLWMGTARGVSRFDGRDWQDYPSSVAPNMLALGPGGEAWAATREGVGRYLPAEDAWITYTEADGLPGGNTYMIAVSPAGQVWVYWPWEGVYVLDDHLDEPAWNRLEDPCRTRLSDLAFAADGTPWAASAGNGHYPGACVAYHNGERWVEIGGDSGLSLTAALALGPSGEVAVSTSQGLAIYARGAWQLLRDGPTSDTVTTTAVTPEGDAWFGFGDSSPSTPGGGLSHFDGEIWHYHLDEAEVTALAVAPDGALWAGVDCSVQRYDGTDWETLAACGEELPPVHILDIAFTSDGEAWVANGFSLARYDGSKWTVHGNLAHSIVMAPKSAAGMQGLWVSGWDGTQDSAYVGRLDGSHWQQYPVAGSYPGSFVPSAVTPEGWLCGLNPGQGLACFEGGDWSSAGAWTIYDRGMGLDLGQALGPPVAAPDGAIWVLTTSGLVRWDASGTTEGAWKLFGLGPDQARVDAGPLAFGPEGEIWIGTTRFQPGWRD